MGIRATKDKSVQHEFGSCFDKTDQDAISVAMERCGGIYFSIFEYDAMDFRPVCRLPTCINFKDTDASLPV